MFQAAHPEAHISCAGRGSIDQEAKRAQGRSNARFGESAHNYNCAIDMFVSLPNKGIYDLEWFTLIMAPEVPDYLEWYGAPGAKYSELAHVELKEWKLMRADGKLSLVEKPHAKRA